MNKLDMQPVMDVLKAAYNTASDLDGQKWDDDAHVPSSERADVSRRISHLADQLVMAAAMVRDEYWIGKGFKGSITQPEMDGE